MGDRVGVDIAGPTRGRCGATMGLKAGIHLSTRPGGGLPCALPVKGGRKGRERWVVGVVDGSSRVQARTREQQNASWRQEYEPLHHADPGAHSAA
jgi:hypothetical protein